MQNTNNRSYEMNKFDALYEAVTVDPSKLLEEGAYYEGPDWDKIKFKEEKEWIYHFEGGGWNGVRAKSKKEAMKKAKEKHSKGKLSMRILADSFKVPTEKEYKQLLSNFY
jgi:hypothetical protein